MSDIINATDSSFDADVLESVLPVLVDFWAPCVVHAVRLPLY